MQGLLPINKPQGITSFSAVSAIKRAAKEKRVGHTGTLDPLATGVLPVLLGRATALSSLMLDADKRYIAKIKLGITTDTDDITGEIISEKKAFVTNDELLSALNAFTGRISQIPPMYSALKRNGVRLYELAREGKKVEIPPRKVEIYEIKLLKELSDDNEFEIEVHVSKGTYIRALSRDLGEFLGVGATLTSLCRIYASGFYIKDCIPLEKINGENVSDYILNEETAVSHLREVRITEKQAVRFCNGGQLGFDRVKINDMSPDELFRVKFEDTFLGVGFADFEKEQIGVKCVINKIQER